MFNSSHSMFNFLALIGWSFSLRCHVCGGRGVLWLCCGLGSWTRVNIEANATHVCMHVFSFSTTPHDLLNSAGSWVVTSKEPQFLYLGVPGGVFSKSPRYQAHPGAFSNLSLYQAHVDVARSSLAWHAHPISPHKGNTLPYNHS